MGAHVERPRGVEALTLTPSASPPTCTPAWLWRMSIRPSAVNEIVEIGFERPVVGEVEHQRFRAAACRTDLLDGRLRAFGVAVGYADDRALPAQ